MNINKRKQKTPLSIASTISNFSIFPHMEIQNIKETEAHVQSGAIRVIPEILNIELQNNKKSIDFMFVSFKTNTLMNQEKEFTALTLLAMEDLNRNHARAICLSNGVYPEELILKEIFGSDNKYGIAMVSLSEKFNTKYNSLAVPIKEKIKSLKFLHDHGLKTWVNMEQYPTPNIVEQDIEEILKEIAFVDRIVFGKLRFNFLATHYLEKHPTFFTDTTKKVTRFCKKNKIECFIED